VRELPGVEVLFERFTVEHATGVLRWRKNGREAKAERGNGYLHVRLDGRLLYVHRVVYAMVYGSDPFPLQVDHINGDRRDNRPDNLRLATNRRNVQHRVKPNTNNTSGHRGVYRHAGKWEACIKAEGRNVYLGRFDEIEDAVATRLAAEIEYDYPERKLG
jgi:hypothetical protein